MSKAFVRESDEAPEEGGGARRLPLLPTGAPDYLTVNGAVRLRAMLESLEARRAAAAAEERGPLDAAAQTLARTLAGATIVPPPVATDRVRFGARVTLRDAQGGIENWRIVGVHETDADAEALSWVSPLAKALMNTRVGDPVVLSTPDGPRRLEVLAIAYH